MKESIKVSKLRSIFFEYIKNARERCFCDENIKCANCEGKEYIQDIWKKIEEETQ